MLAVLAKADFEQRSRLQIIPAQSVVPVMPGLHGSDRASRGDIHACGRGSFNERGGQKR